MISLETPQQKWASSRLEGRTSWNFLSCGRCSRLTSGTSGTRSGGLRKGQSRCELLGGLSGFFSRRCRGLRSCVKWVPELEDSSPVLTWILVYSGESPGESASSRVGACTCAFLPSCSSSVALPFTWIKASPCSIMKSYTTIKWHPITYWLFITITSISSFIPF